MIEDYEDLYDDETSSDPLMPERLSVLNILDDTLQNYGFSIVGSKRPYTYMDIMGPEGSEARYLFWNTKDLVDIIDKEGVVLFSTNISTQLAAHQVPKIVKTLAKAIIAS